MYLWYKEGLDIGVPHRCNFVSAADRLQPTDRAGSARSNAKDLRQNATPIVSSPGAADVPIVAVSALL
jgi:hypothetical protein